MNPKKGKSEVLFGRKPRNKDRTWKLAGGDRRDQCVQIPRDRIKKWTEFQTIQDKIVQEARKRMMLVWAMGMRGGHLAVKDCVRVWQALVRPILEYGTVVWGEGSGRQRSGYSERWAR